MTLLGRMHNKKTTMNFNESESSQNHNPRRSGEKMENKRRISVYLILLLA